MSELEDMKLAERGERAKRLLENDLYNEAWQSVRDALLSEWEKSPQRDVEGRERLHMMLSCMTMVRNHIEGFIQHGKIAAKKLSEADKRRRFKIL